jgi:4-hydroxy-4-methyl-2-oxoglutarate aldolase
MPEQATPTLDELRPRLFGGIPDSLISQVTSPRLTPADLDFLREQTDITCLVADALDALGVGSIVPGTSLPPITPGQRVCGQAVTLRYEPYGGAPATHRRLGSPALAGDRDLYGLAEPGDVAVISAHGDLSAAVAGDISLGFAAAAGIAGVLVDGAVRDVETLRGQPVPVWARGTSPLAARYRWAAAELNGPVDLAGARVEPGDLVVADGNGVCVVPLAEAAGVVAECRRLVVAEARMSEALAEATSLPDLVARVRGSAVL